MACVFSYASLAMFLTVRSGKCRRKGVGYGWCVVYFACALLSKENSVVLPLYFILAEVAFFKPGRKQLFGRAIVYSMVALLVLVVVSFLQHPHGLPELGQGILTTITFYYEQGGLTLKEVVLTQARVLFYYLFITILPLPSHVQLISPQVVSKGLLDPPVTLLAVLGVFTVFGGACWLLSRRPPLGFGILFYFLSLLPEALLVPVYPFVGYRPVLPMFGLCLIAADSLFWLLQLARTGSLRRLAIASVGIFLICAIASAASVTYKKAELWRDPIEFWEETVGQFNLQQKNLERFSTSQALNNLGDAHIRLGSPRDAVTYLQKAIEIREDNWVPYHNLGIIYERSGDLEKATGYFQKALQVNPLSQMTKRALEHVQRQRARSIERSESEE